MRLIRTASSPSLISISAIPDSSSSSMSFFTFRMSNVGLPSCENVLKPGLQPGGRGLDGELVSQGAQPHDAAHRDIGEIRVMPEFLARERVREVQLDERQLHAEECIAQRDAGVRQTTRIEDGEP